jgi:hypothetical protein
MKLAVLIDQCKDLTDALGAEWDEAETITVWAPAGKTWCAENGLHGLTVQSPPIWAGREPAPEDWADLLQRMQLGVEDCQQPDCEVCEAAAAETAS